MTSTAKPITRVRIWDAATGSPLSDWIVSDDPVSAVRFSADGRWIVASAGWKWAVHPVTPPAPEWLPELAETVAGKESLARVQTSLQRLSSSNELARWASELMGFAGSEAK